MKKSFILALMTGLCSLPLLAQTDAQVLKTQRDLVSAKEAWGPDLRSDAILNNGNGIIVAVVDTGVSLFHPELRSKIAMNAGEIPGDGIDNDRNGFIDDTTGWNFVDNNSFVADDNGHGTHVAGVIAGENIGIAPGARILPIKVLNRVGTGQVSQIVRGVEYAIKRGAKVINVSLGGVDAESITKDEYEKIIQLARANNVLVVAAAGNDSRSNNFTPFFPANIMSDNVISVCSIDSQGNLSDFSNFGNLTVHLCAPGTNILSARAGSLNEGDRYIYESGTSQATPFVAAAAAILYASDKAAKSYNIRAAIIDSVDKRLNLRAYNMSSGSLNIKSALNFYLSKKR